MKHTFPYGSAVITKIDHPPWIDITLTGVRKIAMITVDRVRGGTSPTCGGLRGPWHELGWVHPHLGKVDDLVC